MFRGMLTLLSAVAVAGSAVPVMAGDCKDCKLVAAKGEGFCTRCGKGKVFDLDLTSKRLYKLLAGRKIMPEKIKCPGCKEAAKTDGRCEHCGVGLAKGRMYRSTFAHTLAKGVPVSKDKVSHCPGCKKAYQTNGRCTTCNVGYVAGRAFKDESLYKSAKAAFKTVAEALIAAKRCESCAAAMITNGKCTKCNVEYKNGKKITG